MVISQTVYFPAIVIVLERPVIWTMEPAVDMDAKMDHLRALYGEDQGVELVIK